MTIAAAASLRRVLPALVGAYRADQPADEFAFTYAGSGTLRTQVQAGAPIDGVLFASARHVDLLLESGRAEAGTRCVIARNELVLVGGAGSPATTLAGLVDLPAGERVAIGEPDSVPAGRYARELLRARGLWEPLGERLVYAQDVAAVIAYVRRGEVAAGLAYRTEVRGIDGLTLLDVPQGQDVPSPTIVGAVVTGADHGPAMRRFLAWLQEPAAQAIFKSHEFSSP